MTSRSSITVDELLGLVAGTLSHEHFVRVANAVKNDVTLQAQLTGFEEIRSELVHAMVFDKRQVTVEDFAESLVRRLEPPSNMRTKLDTAGSWMSRLNNFFADSSTPARFAYGLVAIQAVSMAWLVSGVLQTNDGSTVSTRTAGAEGKQLGAVPSSVIFNVSFDPATPESTVRGLLLELEAQIIAGPTQLGQYKIMVSRNRSHLALLKLREATFVELVIEVAKESEKLGTKDGEKK